MTDEEKKVKTPYCLDPLPKRLIKAITENFDKIYNDDTGEDDDI
jgi:hypothetical protein